jgi:hypothetical protein
MILKPDWRIDKWISVQGSTRGALFYDYTALKMVQICAISVARRYRMRKKRGLKI